MRGKAFIFETNDGRSREKARDLAREFRHDSMRALKCVYPLKGISFDKLFEHIEAGLVRTDKGILVPVIRGGAQSRYSIAPNTSNAAVVVATATTVKSLLQVATPSTQDITVVQYEVSFDNAVAGKSLTVELVEVDVAATVTSFTPIKFSDPNAPASLCVGGVSATGYNASAEGTIAAYRLFDLQVVPPTGGVVMQFPLGREPGVAISKFLRLRATGSSGVTPNAATTLVWEE